MRFWLLLAVVNVGCFLPHYVLNARVAPNPFAFFALTDRMRWGWLPRLLQARYGSSDPFKVHFDFTFFVLLAATAGVAAPAAELVATLLLAAGFVEIAYTAIMHAIFKRPPAIASDWSLLRAGLSLAQGQVYWMAPVALVALASVVGVAAAATAALFGALPNTPWLTLLVALALVPPCLFRFSRYYSHYNVRTVYSPLLHMILNVRTSRRMKRLYARDAGYYEGFNAYRLVELAGAPNVVLVCVESYGSIAYRDGRAGAGIDALLGAHESELASRGYRFASTFSDAPLFAGGSWLSYASFAYGAPINDVQLYDGLFTRPSGFASYESLFHILRRNGYDNVLVAPLGGVHPDTVDWASLDRCFQSQRRILFDDLGYVGPPVNYFGIIRRHAPPDQFSLNFGYETARRGGKPFSLFFCTLNSHYAWDSLLEAVPDWRSVNVPGASIRQETKQPLIDRYNAAIRYQLDYLLRFAADRSGDAPLIVLFGDHQPPMITAQSMGKETPVHVLSQNPALIDVFLSHGFAPGLNLAGTRPQGIRHEGFLSLLMKALQAAHGTRRGLDLPYRAAGTPVFEELRVGSASG